MKNCSRIISSEIDAHFKRYRNPAEGEDFTRKLRNWYLFDSLFEFRVFNFKSITYVHIE